MRRNKRLLIGIAIVALALAALPVVAQKPIDPRIPPPPPPPEQSVPLPAPPEQPALPAPSPARQPAPPPKAPEPAAPPAWLPAAVVIPAGTRIAVVLDTPLSTRIARQGQLVTFRTSDALRVHDQLEIPPETAFTGNVVEVKRPGTFGRPGVLRVKVNRINLSTGATAEVAARLDSLDSKGQGRLSSDHSRATDLYSLMTYTLEGTLLGGQIKGGKGAAVGAGAGAAVALIIMMSRKGSDLYLEPGMPFLIVLDRAVELPGAAVYDAHQSYARSRGADASQGADSTTEPERSADGTPVDPDRPKLKRRPRTPQR